MKKDTIDALKSMSRNVRRDDLVVPTEMVRDAEGKILGCRSLGR